MYQKTSRCLVGALSFLGRVGSALRLGGAVISVFAVITPVPSWGQMVPQEQRFTECTKAGAGTFQTNYTQAYNRGIPVTILADCRVALSLKEAGGKEAGGRLFANWWAFDSYLKKKAPKTAYSRQYSGRLEAVQGIPEYGVNALSNLAQGDPTVLTPGGVDNNAEFNFRVYSGDDLKGIGSLTQFVEKYREHLQDKINSVSAQNAIFRLNLELGYATAKKVTSGYYTEAVELDWSATKLGVAVPLSALSAVGISVSAVTYRYVPVEGTQKAKNVAAYFFGVLNPANASAGALLDAAVTGAVAGFAMKGLVLMVSPVVGPTAVAVVSAGLVAVTVVSVMNSPAAASFCQGLAKVLDVNSEGEAYQEGASRSQAILPTLVEVAVMGRTASKTGGGEASEAAAGLATQLKANLARLKTLVSPQVFKVASAAANQAMVEGPTNTGTRGLETGGRSTSSGSTEKPGANQSTNAASEVQAPAEPPPLTPTWENASSKFSKIIQGRSRDATDFFGNKLQDYLTTTMQEGVLPKPVPIQVVKWEVVISETPKWSTRTPVKVVITAAVEDGILPQKMVTYTRNMDLEISSGNSFAPVGEGQAGTFISLNGQSNFRAQDSGSAIPGVIQGYFQRAFRGVIDVVEQTTEGYPPAMTWQGQTYPLRITSNFWMNLFERVVQDAKPKGAKGMEVSRIKFTSSPEGGPPKAAQANASFKVVLEFEPVANQAAAKVALDQAISEVHAKATLGSQSVTNALDQAQYTGPSGYPGMQATTQPGSPLAYPIVVIKNPSITSSLGQVLSRRWSAEFEVGFRIATGQ